MRITRAIKFNGKGKTYYPAQNKNKYNTNIVYLILALRKIMVPTK